MTTTPGQPQAEAERLAAWLERCAESIEQLNAAAMLRTLSAELASVHQAISDPENQPSQYGTVPIEYLSDKLKAWEDRWFQRDAQASKAEAERDTLRAELAQARAALKHVNEHTIPRLFQQRDQQWERAQGLAAELEGLKAQAVSTKPMFWVRIRSDGFYERPIHDDDIEIVRRDSGAWTPLYPPATVAAPPTGDESASIDSARAGREG